MKFSTTHLSLQCAVQPVYRLGALPGGNAPTPHGVWREDTAKAASLDAYLITVQEGIGGKTALWYSFSLAFKVKEMVSSTHFLIESPAKLFKILNTPMTQGTKYRPQPVKFC